MAADNPIRIAALIFAIIYLAFPAVLWLPFVPLMRHGYRSPAFAILFTPDRLLFNNWEAYSSLVHWQARVLGINDLDYEFVFLGSQH